MMSGGAVIGLMSGGAVSGSDSGFDSARGSDGWSRGEGDDSSGEDFLCPNGLGEQGGDSLESGLELADLFEEFIGRPRAMV